MIQTEANGQRLAEKMYSNLDGTACFRRLNGTHTIGCSCKYNYVLIFKILIFYFKQLFEAQLVFCIL